MANTFPSTLVIDQGRTFTFSVIWQNQNGTPYDLTGYTANFAIANDYQQTPIINLATGSGITITANTGTIVVTASPSQTELLTGLGYVAELMLTAPNGAEYSLLKSFIQTSKQVVP